jgi:hypothetical protein
MRIFASRSRLWFALLVVTLAGAVAFAFAPAAGAARTAMLAVSAALFVAEIGLAVADHVHSSRQSRD